MLRVVGEVLGDISDINTSVSSSGLRIENRQLRDSLDLGVREEIGILPRDSDKGVAGRLVSSELLDNLDERSSTMNGLEKTLEAPGATEAVARVQQSVEVSSTAVSTGSRNARAQVVYLLQDHPCLLVRELVLRDGQLPLAQGLLEQLRQRSGSPRKSLHQIGMDFRSFELEHIRPDGGFDIGLDLIFKPLIPVYLLAQWHPEEQWHKEPDKAKRRVR